MPRDGFGCLGEGLGEGELGVEAAAGEVVSAVELAGVGHPFIDQDDRRSVFGE